VLKGVVNYICPAEPLTIDGDDKKLKESSSCEGGKVPEVEGVEIKDPASSEDERVSSSWVVLEMEDFQRKASFIEGLDANEFLEIYEGIPLDSREHFADIAGIIKVMKAEEVARAFDILNTRGVTKIVCYAMNTEDGINAIGKIFSFMKEEGVACVCNKLGVDALQGLFTALSLEKQRKILGNMSKDKVNLFLCRQDPVRIAFFFDDMDSKDVFDVLKAMKMEFTTIVNVLNAMETKSCVGVMNMMSNRNYDNFYKHLSRGHQTHLLLHRNSLGLPVDECKDLLSTEDKKVFVIKYDNSRGICAFISSGGDVHFRVTKEGKFQQIDPETETDMDEAKESIDEALSTLGTDISRFLNINSAVARDFLAVRKIFQDTLEKEMKEAEKPYVKMSRRTVERLYGVRLRYSYFISAQGEIYRHINGRDRRGVKNGFVMNGSIKDIYHLESLFPSQREMVRSVVYNEGACFSSPVEASKKFRDVENLLPGEYITYTSAKTRASKHVFILPYMPFDTIVLSEKAAEAGKEIPYKAKLGLLLQAAKGLDAIHKEGWAHFDVKPDNILCDYNWEYPDEIKAALIDLDFAKKHKEEEVLQNKGSPLYVAPEILKMDGERPKGPEAAARADVFSFGMTMWAIMKNEIPEDGIISCNTSVEDGMRNLLELRGILTDEKVDMSFGAGDLPWKRICREMIRITPEDRTPMEKVVVEIEKLL
jgi:hypothetical protein